MKIYLAGQFAKGPIYYQYAKVLRSMGHEVDVRWLKESLNVANFLPAEIASVHDLEDIDNADAIVSFLETAESRYNTGGRHVEFGYAFAKGKRCFIIGAPENIFHELPGIERFYDFEEFLRFLQLEGQETRLQAWCESATPALTQ